MNTDQTKDEAAREGNSNILVVKTDCGVRVTIMARDEYAGLRGAEAVIQAAFDATGGNGTVLGAFATGRRGAASSVEATFFLSPRCKQQVRAGLLAQAAQAAEQKARQFDIAV